MNYPNKMSNLNTSQNKRTIIDYIPYFLDYIGSEKGLTTKTRLNYDHFLRRFMGWLRTENNTFLLPSQLTKDYILRYKNYLSQNMINKKTDLRLNDATINYYLIAVRALLSYFIENNILSLSPTMVALEKSKGIKHYKTSIQNFDSFKLKKLLSMPDIKRLSGLRDRVVLEILCFADLRVAELVALSRRDVKFLSEKSGIALISVKNKGATRNIFLSESASVYLSNYLMQRNDIDPALFINYSSSQREKASRRLTARSIDNIVKFYIRQANLPDSITPESLRNIKIFSILNDEAQAKIGPKLFTHLTVMANYYRINFDYVPDKRYVVEDVSLLWIDIEARVEKEMLWLKKSISVLPEGYKFGRHFIKCYECLYRKIAILIVSGRLRATEIFSKSGDIIKGTSGAKLYSFTTSHGQEWHRQMMTMAASYFQEIGCKIVTEPTLNYGRADLGVIKQNKKLPIYIEIGTVSIYKLWYNFLTMKDCTFLLIPDEKHIIEFTNCKNNK